MFCSWMRMQSNYNCALFLLQVSTVKQIVSMETLKELLHKHERVKLDDPQDRGDLYLLAPMRLLTPILEEEELQADAEPNFNRSVMTVISELLTNHSKSMQVKPSFYYEYQLKNVASYLLFHLQVYQSLSETRTTSQMSDVQPDGRFPDSVESACSTLVSTIEEIRNNQSLSNLYYPPEKKEACPQVIMALIYLDCDF